MREEARGRLDDIGAARPASFTAASLIGRDKMHRRTSAVVNLWVSERDFEDFGGQSKDCYRFLCRHSVLLRKLLRYNDILGAPWISASLT